MSAEVEKRIVEMEFDNAQFKQGVGETIADIKKLDQSLNLENGGEAFANIAKGINKLDVSGLAAGIDEATSKYQGFKSVVVGIIGELGSIMRGGLIGGGIVSALGALPVVAKSISGGMNRASKLAQAKFQFEGLGVAGKELQTIMSGVSNSVNDTAYGLDQAATTASMLFASGVRDAGQLENALMNVSNVAATFNADYNTVADVMSDVASKGKMQGNEFQRLAVAGMNAKAVIAEYLQTEQGAAKYSGLIENFGNTEDAIEDMSRKGVISFELFNDSLSKFAGNAKKSNETLTGVTANIGSALSRTTADFFQSVLHNTQGAILVLNDVRYFINNINKATNELMHNITDEEGNVTRYGTVIQGVLDILKQVHEGLDRINNRRADKNSDGLSTYMHRWHTLMLEIEPLIKGFFDRVASITKPFVIAVLRVTAVFRELFRIAIRIVKPIAQAFDEVFGDTIVSGVKFLSKSISWLISNLRRLKPSAQTMENLHTVFSAFFSVIKPGIDLLGWLFEVVERLFIIGFKSVAIAFEGVMQVVNAFFDAISPLGEALGEIVGAILDGFGLAGKEIINSLKDTNKWLNNFNKFIRKAGPEIKKFFEPLKQWATDAAKAIRESKIIEWIKDNVPKAVDAAKGAFETLAPVVQAAFGALVEFASGPLWTAITSAFQFIGDTIGNAADMLGVSQAFASMGEGASDGESALGGFGEKLSEIASNALPFLSTALENVANFIGMVATLIWNTVSPAIDWLGQLFTQLWGIIQNVASSFDFGPAFSEFVATAGQKADEFFKSFEEGSPNLIDFFEFLGSIAGDFGQMFLEVLPKFGEFMSQIGSDVAGATDGPLADLGNFIETLKTNLEAIPGIITSIPDSIGTTIGDIFGALAETIKNPFAVEKAWADTGEGDGSLSSVTDKVNEMEEEAFRLSDAIKKITKVLKEPATSAKEFASETFSGAMEGVAAGINNGLSAFDFNVINGFIEGCKDVVIAGSAIWGTISLTSVFESIREIFLEMSNWARGITNIISSVEGVFKSVRKVFDTIATNIDKIGDAVVKSIRANNFLKYAIGTIALIGTVVAAIIILGRTPVEELKRGGNAVAQIMGVLLIYSFLMMLLSRINNSSGAVQTLAGLIGMGLALLMVARAIQKLGSMKEEELIRGSVVVGIMLFLLGMMGSLVGVASEHGLKGAAALLAFGLVLRSIAATIGIYALIPWAQYEKGMTRIGGVILAMIVAMAGVALAGRWSKGQMAKAAAAILAMSACFIAMAVAIGILNLVTAGNAMQAVILGAVLAGMMVLLAGSLTLVGRYGKQLGPATGAMAAISACLVLLSMAIGILNFVTMGNPVTAVTMALVLVGMLYGMAGALILVGRKTRQLPNATTGIWTMTLALVAIGAVLGVMTLLAAWNTNAFITAAVAIGALMLILAGSIWLAGREGSKIEAAIPAIWNMTLAIVAIGAAMTAMMLASGGNWAVILAAAVALGATVILLAAAIRILAGVGGQATVAATAMLEMSAAIALMAVSLMILGSMSIPQLVQGFIALVAALVILGVAAAGVSALSGFFVVFDGILLVLAVSLALIAASVYIFVEALARLAEIAPEAFQSIIDNKDRMVQAFSAMGEAVAAGIQAFFAALIGGIGDGLTAAAQAVEGKSGEIFNAAAFVGKNLVGGIIAGLAGLVIGLGQALFEGISGAIAYANSQTPTQGLSPENFANQKEWNDYLKKTATEATNQMPEGVKESDAPNEAGKAAEAQIEEGAVEASENADTSKIFENMFNLEKLKELGFSEEMIAQYTSMFDSESFKGIGTDLGASIPGGILEGVGQNKINPTDLLGGMGIVSGFGDTEAKSAGTGIGAAVSAGAAESMAETSPVEAAVSAQVTAIGAHAGEYRTKGNESGTQYGQGVNDGIVNTDINTSIVANTAKMAAALEPAKSAGTSVGNAFSTGTSAGISAMSWIVNSAARAITSGAKNSADGYDAGYHPGYWFGQGMADGIDNRQGAVADAAIRLVEKAMAAADEKAKSKSPSREMMKRGRWFGEGYAIGIKMTGSMVAQQASNMVGMAMDEVQTSFGVMDDFLSGVDWDATPTITPILDTSQYEAAFASMSEFDTSPQAVRAGWADRVFSRTPSTEGANNQNGGSTHVEVHLDWHAGVTANQMAQTLATALESQLALEGR